MLMTNVQHLLFSGKSRLAPWSRLGGRPSRGECWLGWEWEWERGIEGKTCEGVGMGMRTGNRGGGRRAREWEWKQRGKNARKWEWEVGRKMQ